MPNDFRHAKPFKVIQLQRFL